MGLIATGGLVAAVSKALLEDPEAGAILVDEAVSNWMLDTAEEFESVIQPVIAEDVLRRVRLSKRALGRSYVEAVSKGEYPEDTHITTAQYLNGLESYALTVSKAWETHRTSDGRTVRRFQARDNKGRFASIDTRTTSEPLGRASKDTISPHLVNQVGMHPETGALMWHEDASTNAQYQERAKLHQSQFEQAQAKAKELIEDFLNENPNAKAKDAKIVFTVVPTNGGQARRVEIDGRDARRELPNGLGDINPLDENVVSAQLEPQGLARFNTLDASTFEAFGRQRGDIEEPGINRLFNRLAAGSEVLRAIPGAEKAALWAQLVGQHGPEAERILGPYVRQAAYRYRGTEKRPDTDLLTEFNSEDYGIVRELAADNSPSSEVLSEFDAQVRSGMEGKKRNFSPVVGSAVVAAQSGLAGDSLRMQVASDLATEKLIETLPVDSITSRLSEQSGHVLPSQGVLINSDGEMVSQSVGYADDHYLPFDLRNLVSLRGGQYVRTRVTGGLTGEDVYTAVQAGARMVTVVSQSGVYSLEFDKDFRGLRGNSDKARQMYERYLKILDAVDKSGLYLRDLTGPQKAQVRRQAEIASMGDPERYGELEAQGMAQARRMAAVLDEAELNELYAQAEKKARNTAGFANQNQPAQLRLIDDYYNELFDEASSKTVAPLALNAEGYKVALETLQQQFPYFIKRVSYEPLRSNRNAKDEQVGGRGFLEARGLPTLMGAKQRSYASDSGYVRPGALRPNTAREGYFAASGVEVPLKEYRGGRQGEVRPWTDSQESDVEGTANSGQSVGGTAGPRAAGGKVTGSNPPAASPRATGSNPPASSPVEQALAVQQQKAEKLANDGLKSLQQALRPLDFEEVLSLRDKNWEEVKASGQQDSQKARWIFAHGLDSLPQILNDETGRKLLSNRGQVRDAFLSVFNSGGQLDYELGEENSTIRSLLGGVQNAGKAADEVAAMVQQVLDARDMTTPFIEPGATPEVVAYHTGSKPQRLPGLVEYTSAEQIANGPADVQALSPVVAEIGYDKDGNYLPMDAVAANVAGRIKLLERINRQMSIESQSSAVQQDPDKFTVANIANNMGETPETLSAAMGKPVQTPADLRRSDVDARAMQLQRAWTLLTTERSIQMLQVGGLPKEPILRREVKPEVSPPTQQKQPPQEEGEETSKAFSSPRQVLRLPAHHPLAIEVALRKAAGKSLLPK